MRQHAKTSGKTSVCSVPNSGADGEAIRVCVAWNQIQPLGTGG
jgi:hypothetical protein